jgi:hypothetical protein
MLLGLAKLAFTLPLTNTSTMLLAPNSTILPTTHEHSGGGLWMLFPIPVIVFILLNLQVSK